MLKVIRILIVIIIFFGMSLAMLPFFILRPFDPYYASIFVRAVFPLVFKFLGIKVVIRNPDRFKNPKPSVWIFNHQHTYDLFVFGMLLSPKSVTIAKKDLLFIPIFGQIFWLSDHILINRSHHDSAMKSMKKAEEAITKKGYSIWISPEGTRSWGKGLGTFKKGAFHLALVTGVPIIPVVASTMRQKINLNRWDSGHIIVEALDPIPTAGRTLEDVDSLIEIAHARMSSTIASMDEKKFNSR